MISIRNLDRLDHNIPGQRLKYFKRRKIAVQLILETVLRRIKYPLKMSIITVTFKLMILRSTVSGRLGYQEQH